MKKRVYLLALVFLACLPFISAEGNESEGDSTYSIEFNIDKSRIQLGDNILIDGSIFKDNDLFEEQVNMKFYFTSESDQNEIYLSIFDGTFSLSPWLRDLQNGDYDISVELIDLEGNSLHYFDNLQSLFIDNTLVLDLSLENDQLNPGDKLQILGSILRNLDRKEIPLGLVTVELDGVEYITEVSNGNLDYEIILNDNIRSNFHGTLIKVEDSFGNRGEIVLDFYFIPQEESLELILEKKSFFPGEEMRTRVALYDQSNTEIIEDVNIQIFNTKGKKVFEEDFSTSSYSRYLLQEFALPGEWKIQVKSNKMETEKFVEVLISKNIELELLAQSLKIKNSGNVKYEDPLVLLVSNGEYEKTIEFRTGLKPGSNISIDLFKFLDDGNYDVKSLNTNETFNLEIYDERGFGSKTGDFFKSITGQAVHVSGSKNSNAASYGFGIIFLLLIVFSAFFFNRGIFAKKVKNVKPGKFKSKNVQSKILRKSEEDKEIEDFKTRILKDIEKSGNDKDEKKENNKPFNVQPFFPIQKEKTEKPERFSFDKPLRKK